MIAAPGSVAGDNAVVSPARRIVGNYNISDYGAIGDFDGTTPITDSRPAFIIARELAIAAGGGNIIFPPAEKGYLFDGDMEVFDTDGINLIGFSHTFDFGAAAYRPGAVMFNNAAHGPVFRNNSNFNINGILFDGNNVAQVAMICDRLTLSNWPAISFVRFTHSGPEFTDTSGSGAVLFNEFGVMNIELCGRKSLTWTGVPDISGVYHNVWNLIRIVYAGDDNADPAIAVAGHWIEQADNNLVHLTMYFCNSGTGKGAYLHDISVSHPPNQNDFSHMQAGVNGIKWDPSVADPGTIKYDMSNGQPKPVGYPGMLITDGYNNKGVYLTAVFPGTSRSSHQEDVCVAAEDAAPSNGDGLDGWSMFRGKGDQSTPGLYTKRNGVWRPYSTPLDVVQISGQHADIAPANFANCAGTGLYRITGYATTTAEDAGAGNLSLIFTYTDRLGVFTQTVTLPLTTTTRTSFDLICDSRAASLAWQATNTPSTYGAARFAVDMKVERVL